MGDHSAELKAALMVYKLEIQKAERWVAEMAKSMVDQLVTLSAHCWDEMLVEWSADLKD